MNSVLNIIGTTCVTANIYYKLSDSQEFTEFVTLIKKHGFGGYFEHSLTTIIKSFLHKSHLGINTHMIIDGKKYDEPEKILEKYLYELFFVSFTQTSNYITFDIDIDTMSKLFATRFINEDDIKKLLDKPLDIEKIHDNITFSIVETIKNKIKELEIEKLFEEDGDDNVNIFINHLKSIMGYLNNNATEHIDYVNNDSDDDNDDNNDDKSNNGDGDDNDGDDSNNNDDNNDDSNNNDDNDDIDNNNNDNDNNDDNDDNDDSGEIGDTPTKKQKT